MGGGAAGVARDPTAGQCPTKATETESDDALYMRVSNVVAMLASATKPKPSSDSGGRSSSKGAKPRSAAVNVQATIDTVMKTVGSERRGSSATTKVDHDYGMCKALCYNPPIAEADSASGGSAVEPLAEGADAARQPQEYISLPVLSADVNGENKKPSGALLKECASHSSCLTCGNAFGCGWCGSTGSAAAAGSTDGAGGRCVIGGYSGPSEGMCKPSLWSIEPKRCANVADAVKEEVKASASSSSGGAESDGDSEKKLAAASSGPTSLGMLVDVQLSPEAAAFFLTDTTEASDASVAASRAFEKVCTTVCPQLFALNCLPSTNTLRKGRRCRPGLGFRRRRQLGRRHRTGRRAR